jgi:hypothetical protein
MAKRKNSQKSTSGNKHKKPNRGAATSASSPANQQVSSKFMQLPQEIRDEIYSYVFCSTRFASGNRTVGQCEGRRLVSSFRGTVLALLRTCCRVRDEIGISWLHKVHFHFEDSYSLLDKLAGIPITVRKQIRHVRVLENSVMIWVDNRGDSYHGVAQVSKLLPGLELGTLTVLGEYGCSSSYENLDKLVRYGDGWKELHYLSQSSYLLGYKFVDTMGDYHLRQPQPANWQNALEQRDEQSSHPSVIVYRANTAAVPGAILQPDGRYVFTQAFASNQDERTFGNIEEDALMCPEEVGTA